MPQDLPQSPQYTSHKRIRIIQIVIAIVCTVAIVTVSIVLTRHNQAASQQTKTHSTTLGNACVGRAFTVGDSGQCVRDAQLLVNYMEHSGLTECPFHNGATLVITGAYSQKTATQVRAVQQWSSCYAKQEGFTSAIKQSGRIDKLTWRELCTYSYTDPLHRGAANASAAIAAGRNAGCANLSAS